jgi:hypothetical protein
MNEWADKADAVLCGKATTEIEHSRHTPGKRMANALQKLCKSFANAWHTQGMWPAKPAAVANPAPHRVRARYHAWLPVCLVCAL